MDRKSASVANSELRNRVFIDALGEIARLHLPRLVRALILVSILCQIRSDLRAQVEPTWVTNDRQSRPSFSLLTVEIADCYGAEVTPTSVTNGIPLSAIGVKI